MMQGSLLSLATPVLKRKPQHNLSKVVAERSIAKTSDIASDDLSCSSISNIDNIQPASVMDELDSSVSPSASGRSSAGSVNISSQAIRNIVQPAGRQVQCFGDSSFSMDFDLSHASVSQQLDEICPPTLLDEITLTSHTFVIQPVPGTTFIVVDAGNTIDDVTDVFDEESTMTVGEGDENFYIPELPYDTLQASPAHSNGDSSTKTTPVTVRKKPLQNLDGEDSTIFAKPILNPIL